MPARTLADRLPPLVDRIVSSYQQHPNIQNIDCEFLPDRQQNIEICNLLMELTYPAYLGRKDLTRHNISYHVGELLPRLWDLLCQQITQCLCICEQLEDPSHPPADEAGHCRHRARELAEKFLDRIPDVRTRLAQDVQAAYDGDPAAINTAEVILAYPGLFAVTIYRFAHELYTLNIPLMPRIMTEYVHQRSGIDIHPGARIGRSFFIDHGTGVVIGETTHIGDFVKIYQGVTLGALSFPKDERGRLIRGAKRHPTVGDRVTIYANAIILGGETVIGDDAVIGGSVFITESVQPNHQISLTPPVLKVRPRRPARAEPATPDASHTWSDWVI